MFSYCFQTSVFLPVKALLQFVRFSECCFPKNKLYVFICVQRNWNHTNDQKCWFLSQFWSQERTMSIETSTVLCINAHWECLMFLFSKSNFRASPMWNCVQKKGICEKSTMTIENVTSTLHTAVKGRSLFHFQHKFVCQFVCLSKWHWVFIAKKKHCWPRIVAVLVRDWRHQSHYPLNLI